MSGKVRGSADNPNRPKAGQGMRDRNKIQRLLMYRGGKPKRNKTGKIIGGQYMMKDKAGGEDITAVTGRVPADRRWFGNTKVVSQQELDKFREALSASSADPYKVVLHSKATPMGLLADPKNTSRVNLLTAESFETTFGPKKQRKRVKLAVRDMESLAATAAEKGEVYDETGALQDTNRIDNADQSGLRDEARHALFDKGTSRRIWNELYKVLDCSDVVIQVLDARNPMGTRSLHVEKHIRENCKHKHLIFVLNKCDLVPTWVTRRWVATLSKEYPTLAFQASLTKPFGKGALIAVLRQFARLHSEKRSISVGFIGYPNTGKSSVINALKMKKVCSVAPIPGQTKVWQYVSLMKRVSLIDCPGVVYDSGDSEQDIVMKAVVRAEKLLAPELYVAPILERVKREHVVATYGIPAWEDAMDFLTKLATKTGRLIKGGEPDIAVVAINVINDWQRGKLPYYSVPPELPADSKTAIVGNKASASASADGAGSAAASGGASGAASLGVDIPQQDLRGLGRHELLLAEEADEGEGEDFDAGSEDLVSEDGDAENDGADMDAEEAEAEADAGAKRGRAGSSAGSAKGKPKLQEQMAGRKRKRAEDGDAEAAPAAKSGRDAGNDSKKRAKLADGSASASASASAHAASGRPAKQAQPQQQKRVKKADANKLAEALLRQTMAVSSGQADADFDALEI
jgi:nuclear GTP-binding protein